MLYFHRISDNLLAGRLLKNFRPSREQELNSIYWAVSGQIPEYARLRF